MLINLNLGQIIYIILTIIVLLLLIFLYFYPLIKRKYYKKKYHKIYYKVIDKLVMDKDYLLINDFIIKSYNIHIDHIIFANKYIYLIKDTYVEGALDAKLEDNKWIYYKYLNNDVSTISNTFNELEDNLVSLIKLCGLNSNLFYLINIINDDALINFKNKRNNNYNIVAKSKLIEYINSLESNTSLLDINQEQLEKAVLNLSRINERDNKN